MKKIVFICGCLAIVFSCTPNTEFWIVEGTVIDASNKEGIDSAEVYLSVPNIELVDHSEYTDSSGIFRHYPYSTEVFNFDDLRKLDFHFIISKKGYIEMDTIISGDLLRYGSIDNYRDTVYLDSVALIKDLNGNR